MRHWIALLCTAFLTACVGSGNTTPTVSDIQAKNLFYGAKAEFEFSGTYLDIGLSANIPNCSGQVPLFVSPTQQVLSCSITTTGDIPVQVMNGDGAVIFTKTFTVPPPQVALVTSMGNIIAELDPVHAPLSVINFLKYVQIGYYSNTLFHRVIAGFVIQGGAFSPGLVPKSGSFAPIALESNNGLGNLRGSMAMARTSDPNSATSQFYFNLADNPSLDFQDAGNPGYAVFGKIVQGLDVMDAIGAVPTATQDVLSDVPVSDVVIKNVLRIQ